MIGLSLLPTAHPRAFQRPPVRTSRRSHPSFILAMGRSPGFASASADYIRPVRTRFRFGSAPRRGLTSPATATRRLIMQKARRHTRERVLRPLAGARFQGLFHSSARGAFHLSLTVLVRYRSLGSIQPCGMGPADSRRIPRAPRYSGAGSAAFSISTTGLSPAAVRLSRRFVYA